MAILLVVTSTADPTPRFPRALQGIVVTPAVPALCDPCLVGLEFDCHWLPEKSDSGGDFVDWILGEHHNEGVGVWVLARGIEPIWLQASLVCEFLLD